MSTVDSSFLSPGAWSAILQRFHLSQREAQIFQLILCDKTEGAIAMELGISAHTVHTHLERLYRKLDVSSRCQVVIRVFQEYVRLSLDVPHAGPESQMASVAVNPST
jgi:DNA-binding NarL/FixJ family response regulator